MLQDCFESTNWNVFEHQDLQQYTPAVLDCIKHCTDSVTVACAEAWMTRKVQGLLKKHHIAFMLLDLVMSHSHCQSQEEASKKPR